MGYFITFEGIEGAGKSTQARLLSQWLSEKGAKVLLTREPGGGLPWIRPHLLEKPLSPLVEYLLFSADRAEHTKRIEEALAQGAWVVSDRYLDSSLAYQGFGFGLDLEWMLQVAKKFVLKPHLTFLLDLPPEEGLKRAREKNLFEGLPLDFHQKVRQGYLRLAEEEPDRFVVLDATEDPKTLQGQIQRVIMRLWGWPPS